MSSKSESEELIIAPVPALVAVLLSLETQKGTDLTEAEVLVARDKAACIAMPPHAHRAVVEERGYDDIDPKNVWAEWLEFKATTSSSNA
jgi:hypothetical protein